MKKIFILVFLIVPLTLKPAYSSGIPTVDIAALLQGLADGLVRIQEFKQQLDQAKERLKQLKDSADHYKEMVDGHYDFETLLNDPTINKALALDEWEDIYKQVQDVSDLREEFELNSDNPIVQDKLDRKLQIYKAQSNFYKTSVKRNNNLNQLLKQFSAAKNPAAKADLANSIHFENTQIKNDATMMKNMTALMAQNAMLEHTKRTLGEKFKIKNNKLEVDY